MRKGGRRPGGAESTPGEGESIIAQRIREQMAEAGLTPHALSHQAGLGKGVVGAILTGQTRTVRQRTMARLAAALGVSAAYLAGDVDTAEGATQLTPWVQVDEPSAAVRAAVAATLASRSGSRAYIAGPGAEGLGVPGGARIVVDPGEGDRDGMVAAVLIPGRGAVIRCRAKPYWIGVNNYRCVTDLDAPGLRILGGVVLVVTAP